LNQGPPVSRTPQVQDGSDVLDSYYQNLNTKPQPVPVSDLKTIINFE
jgi:hypothetical protein